MKKKILFILLAMLPLISNVPAGAQQPKKIPRIGYLGAASYAANEARVQAFRQGLREAGYIEGKNIVIEYRFAEGRRDSIPALAAELVALKVDVLVTGGSTATRPAKAATSTIPIVMTNDADPVGDRFVASLARPGGNVTGLSTLSLELSGKRLELLKEAVPSLARVAVLGNLTAATNAQALKELDRTAAALAVKLQYLDVQSAKDIESSFRTAGLTRADAVLWLSSTVLIDDRAQAVHLAVKGRLPTIYYRPELVDGGGLMSYSTSLTELARRAAWYVDKILKGAKPGDLPVEQPTKFELVINLKTAKQIGLTIPPNVLARADRVIK
jgi:putative tryptophan/tyrosine transport system substrate-binding protein